MPEEKWVLFAHDVTVAYYPPR